MYALGGLYSYATPYLASIDIYDMATQTWSTVTGGTARSMSASVIDGGKLYILGGQSDPLALNTMDIYDIAKAEKMVRGSDHGASREPLEKVAGKTSSLPSAPVCTSWAPASAPDLFQIEMGDTRATVSYTPVLEADRYFLAFSSVNRNAEEHGVEYVPSHAKGVQSYTVNYLQPNTSYYFKVRAGNGCMPGPWSRIMEAKTGSSKAFINIFYRYWDTIKALRVRG